MRRFCKILPYAAAVIFGAVVTPWATQYAVAQRGQAGLFGGEYLIIPLLLLLVALIKGLAGAVKTGLKDR
jgi:hypothetical protein